MGQNKRTKNIIFKISEKTRQKKKVQKKKKKRNNKTKHK